MFYGGSGAMSTPASLLNNAAVGTSPPGVYQVAGPVGFSPGDAIAVVQGANCTLSTINAGGVSVAVGTGIATLSHTLTSTPGNNTTANYSATSASLVNLGQGDRFARTLYSVDLANTTMKVRSQLPTVLAAAPPVASNVVNLKAQYGLDTDGDGQVDTWQAATGNWSSANLPLQLSALARRQDVVPMAAHSGGAGRDRHPQRKVRDRGHHARAARDVLLALLLVRSR